MMASEVGIGPRKKRKTSSSGPVPYVLHSLFADVPIATEHSSDAYITSVEYWSKHHLSSAAGPVVCF